MLETVVVPDIGDYSDVEIIGIAVQAGDSISLEDELITLETDKATMEIPAPKAGVIGELLVKLGDRVSRGSPILTLELAYLSVGAVADERQTTADRTSEANDRREQDADRRGDVAERRTDQPDHRDNPVEHRFGVDDRRAGTTDRRAGLTDLRDIDISALPGQEGAYAGPGVRRYARELGVDLNFVDGSGRKDRILQNDVQSFVQQTMQKSSGAQGGGGLNVTAAPTIDFKQFGSIDIQPLSRIQKISGTFLHRNWVTIPHVTQFDEADITELEMFRQGQKQIAEKQGLKLTPIVFILKAVVAGLKQFAKFNSSLSSKGDELILKQYFNIGVAVDTPNGLVVPVIRNVDQKGLFELAADLSELSKKARDGKLSGADMQGGCFTISSLGGIGGTAFTPIINAPEVAILGVSKAQTKLMYNADLPGDSKFHARLMLPLSLSYDHRVIDGAEAARFSSFIVNLLADIRRLLL